MNLAASYAQGLYDLTKANGPKTEYLASLKEALSRRGHEKLLPKIFTEYQLLALKEERSDAHRSVSPEQERTRQLLTLYKKLIATEIHE
jgi:hypothetical protein